MLTKKDKKKRYNKKTRSLTGHEFGMGTKSLEVAKDALKMVGIDEKLYEQLKGICDELDVDLDEKNYKRAYLQI